MRKDKERLAERILKKLKLEGIFFCVTGSWVAKNEGIIDREIKDLDLMTCDTDALDLLSRICIDVSETVGDGHYRYLYEDTLFIDVFIREKIELNELTTRVFGSTEINIRKPEYDMIQKTLNLGKVGTLNGRQRKIINDLRDYLITQTYNK